MEYIFVIAAIGLVIAILIALGLYLIRKLTRFYRAAKPLWSLMQQVTVAANASPRILAPVSTISDDPGIHEAARRRLLAKRRQLKARESRRLASRVFSR
jgi:biopolymer transport protein ExbB/TolQ